MPAGSTTVNHGHPSSYRRVLITLSGGRRVVLRTRSCSCHRLAIRMRFVVRPLIIALVSVVGCGGGAASTPSTNPTPEQHPLVALAATGAIVTPAFSLRIAPDLDWGARIGPSRDFLRAFDSDIAAALAERGLKNGWVLPPDLAATYRRNPTYATDPYALAEEPLRSPAFVAGSRLPEPLATELRTMIALQDNARAVLAPIELRFERADAASGNAHARLRLALIDPRFSEARWVGEVKSDTTSMDPRVLAAAVARRVADLVTAR
jgi:hypothetical protein